jgi:hypothetical protein
MMTVSNPARPAPESRRDPWFYLLATVAGMGTGWADVAVGDLLFTALLVLASSMLLGLLRPRRPWRWVVVIGLFIPLTELVLYKIMQIRASSGQIYGAALAFLPGIAGAYGGSLMRGVVDNLLHGR